MTLWSGGRFKEGPSESLWQFTVDTSDRRMLIDDIDGSVAHATMLGRVGLLTPDEAGTMLEGLGGLKDEAVAGKFAFLDTDEDVHSAVERRLSAAIGDLAGKLHTGRSRNDQVALDLRLYLKRSANDRVDQLESFLRLHSADDGSDGGRGGHFAKEHILAGEEWAGITEG